MLIVNTEDNGIAARISNGADISIITNESNDCMLVTGKSDPMATAGKIDPLLVADKNVFGTENVLPRLQ